MNNKNGISAIVATVLIILITVAAVTIIWAAIIPLVTDSLAGATECQAADRALMLENKGYTCIDATTGIVKVQVSLGSEDVVLTGVQILVSTAGSTSAEEIFTGLPLANEEKVLTTNLPYVGATGVSVAPMITVGGSSKTCTVSNEVALVDCIA
ncbi:MAG: hypothetical protein KJ592_01680 [Nanoarchaeota archaeon]|nr:hypothetical protein [Nanoarchaeota archaeon]